MKAKSWGEVKEVQRESAGLRCTPWVDLYHELCLRLERTSSDAALIVPFANQKIAYSARASLQRQFNRAFPGQVRVSQNGCNLFVCWADDTRRNPGKAYHKASRRQAAEEA